MNKNDTDKSTHINYQNSSLYTFESSGVIPYSMLRIIEVPSEKI